MEHLAEQRVLDLVNGALAGSVAVAAHRHLDECHECREVVAAVVRGSETQVGPGAGIVADDGVTTDATRGEVPRTRRAEKPARVDEYELGELLGRGGMGSVYRARDTLLDRDVALKLITPTSSAGARQRFVVEARAVARIRHPNVVTVHRVGVAGDQPFIVYELVRGSSFDELRRPLPWPKALELAVGIARGLAAAHACSVLHRDIKPANIMRDEHGDVVLVDFGLAKLGEHEVPPTGDVPAGPPNLTAEGAALGTPRYMAPESWRGRAATPQTDLYSLGLVLYELLAGRLPFADTPANQLARRVCSDDAPPLASAAPWVPATLGRLVDRCLARDPAQRPAGAELLATELEAMQRGRAFEDFERDRVRRVPPGNPYPGARPFGFEHQGVFFGRRRELRALVDELRTRQLVVIAGEAGAGKTSLCLAGLLPIVSRGALGGARKWVPVTVVPGGHPLAALATAIAPHVELDMADVERGLAGDPADVIARFRAGHRGGCTAHVLFVDRLEDLVTVADRDEAARFAAILARLAAPADPASATPPPPPGPLAEAHARADLLALGGKPEFAFPFADGFAHVSSNPACGPHVPALKVLATVRASHMFAVAQLPGLQSVMCPAIHLVLEPRDEAALREIVVEPARLTGRSVDEVTVHALVTAASAGQLPLGQLAARLAELWTTTLTGDDANRRGPTT